MRLENKVAIVTGSSIGLGRAIAIRLAAEGADVVVTGHSHMSEANEVARQIESLGRRAMTVRVDVSKSQEVSQMVRATLDRFGAVDILVNNAGGSARERKSMFHQSTEEVWDQVLGANLKGTINCCRAVINHMIERRSGKILNMGSVAGMIGSSVGMADYGTAKAGIIGFTMSLAKEVGKYGINVNCVSPGPLETDAMKSVSEAVIEQFKKSTFLNRLGKPEEVAALVAFMVSDEAGFVTGQNYAICGGRNLGV